MIIKFNKYNENITLQVRSNNPGRLLKYNGIQWTQNETEPYEIKSDGPVVLYGLITFDGEIENKVGIIGNDDQLFFLSDDLQIKFATNDYVAGFDINGYLMLTNKSSLDSNTKRMVVKYIPPSNRYSNTLVLNRGNKNYNEKMQMYTYSIGVDYSSLVNLAEIENWLGNILTEHPEEYDLLNVFLTPKLQKLFQHLGRAESSGLMSVIKENYKGTEGPLPEEGSGKITPETLTEKDIIDHIRGYVTGNINDCPFEFELGILNWKNSTEELIDDFMMEHTDLEKNADGVYNILLADGPLSYKTIYNKLAFGAKKKILKQLEENPSLYDEWKEYMEGIIKVPDWIKRGDSAGLLNVVKESNDEGPRYKKGELVIYIAGTISKNIYYLKLGKITDIKYSLPVELTAYTGPVENNKLEKSEIYYHLDGNKIYNNGWNFICSVNELNDEEVIVDVCYKYPEYIEQLFNFMTPEQKEKYAYLKRSNDIFSIKRFENVSSKIYNKISKES